MKRPVDLELQQPEQTATRDGSTAAATAAADNDNDDDDKHELRVASAVQTATTWKHLISGLGLLRQQETRESRTRQKQQQQQPGFLSFSTFTSTHPDESKTPQTLICHKRNPLQLLLRMAPPQQRQLPWCHSHSTHMPQRIVEAKEQQQQQQQQRKLLCSHSLAQLLHSCHLLADALKKSAGERMAQHVSQQVVRHLADSSQRQPLPLASITLTAAGAGGGVSAPGGQKGGSSSSSSSSRNDSSSSSSRNDSSSSSSSSCDGPQSAQATAQSTSGAAIMPVGTVPPENSPGQAVALGRAISKQHPMAAAASLFAALSAAAAAAAAGCRAEAVGVKPWLVLLCHWTHRREAEEAEGQQDGKSGDTFRPGEASPCLASREKANSSSSSNNSSLAGETSKSNSKIVGSRHRSMKGTASSASSSSSPCQAAAAATVEDAATCLPPATSSPSPSSPIPASPPSSSSLTRDASNLSSSSSASSSSSCVPRPSWVQPPPPAALRLAEEIASTSAVSWSGFIRPVDKVWEISSQFGPRWGRQHNGVDLAAPEGEPVLAADAGRVTFAGWEPSGFGYLVEITHDDGWRTLYAHNSQIFAWTGKRVERGECISLVGETGKATGPHLHWEIRNTQGCPVDPAKFVPL